MILARSLANFLTSPLQGITVAAGKQQPSPPPPPPQINLSRLQPEPPQPPPASGRARAAAARGGSGGKRQTAPASVIAVAEAATLAGVGAVVVQPAPPPPHPRPPPGRQSKLDVTFGNRNLAELANQLGESTELCTTMSEKDTGIRMRERVSIEQCEPWPMGDGCGEKPEFH